MRRRSVLKHQGARNITYRDGKWSELHSGFISLGVIGTEPNELITEDVPRTEDLNLNSTPTFAKVVVRASCVGYMGQVHT